MEEGNSSPRLAIKTLSFTKLILLNIITGGLYSIYWYLTRTSMLLAQSERKISPWLYLVGVGLAAWRLFFLFAEEATWAKWCDLSLSLVTFIWILWLSRLVFEIWKVRLGPNRFLSSVNLYIFGHLYLQYKLNLIADSREREGVVSSDKWLNRLITPACVVFLIIFVMRMFFINWYNIPTAAMTPTIIPGDRVLSSRVAYRNIDDIERGDVIVFKYPKNPAIDYVKRVTGKPGDKIRIDDNQVYVNDVPQLKTKISAGKLSSFLDHVNSEYILYQEKIGDNLHLILEHPPVSQFSSYRSFPSPLGTYYTVPKDSLFVLGDYRDNSSDSRIFGKVPFENVRGKVLMVIWSRKNQKDGSGFFQDGRFFLDIN